MVSLFIGKHPNKVKYGDIFFYSIVTGLINVSYKNLEGFFLVKGLLAAVSPAKICGGQGRRQEENLISTGCDRYLSLPLRLIELMPENHIQNSFSVIGDVRRIIKGQIPSIFHKK